jgi:primosomal protein N' (replication factor Y)
VANELTKHFPKARVLRFDKDTINSTADYIEAYEKIVQGKIDFIVGTQMIAKGWDIPKLTLVGLVLADNGFNFPDYHTYERMFSLIVQVIGRSGRREEDSRAIIQTYNAENPVTLDAMNQDYEHFARQELISRKNLGWPPFTQVVRLVKTGKDLKQLQLTTGRKVEELRKTLPLASINSGSCFFAKLNGEYRYQIVMRGEKLNQKLTKTNLSGWTVDVDPVNML